MKTKQEQKGGISFEITSEQFEKLRAWKNDLPKKKFGAIDFGYTYCFTPTGIGESLVVTRSDGYEINLTDYDMW